MYFAEGQVASSLAVCFIAVCFGTQQGMFPVQVWCYCPSPAHHGPGSQYTLSTPHACMESGQSFPTCPGPSVQAAAPLFTLGGHPGMSLAVFPSYWWSLAGCLSCWVRSCTVWQHIFHSDLCVCTFLHMLLSSVNTYQAPFALWHAIAQ